MDKKRMSDNNLSLISLLLLLILHTTTDRTYQASESTSSKLLAFINQSADRMSINVLLPNDN